MAVKVFLTGASGYVGGDALDHVYAAHPDNEYTLLVKNEQQAEPIKAKYPDVKFVYGTLEQSDLIRDTCLETDVVIHTAESADNVPGTVAIAKGLEEGHSKDKPAYWIHTSGTAILNFYDAEKKRYGEAPVPEEAYHDIKDIKRLVSLPDDAPHRNVDLMVQEVPSDIVRVAIVSPPTIYDAGAGAIRTVSRQVPLLVRLTLKNGYAPIIGAGKTEWDHVNVSDLGDLFVTLLDASQDPSKNSNPEIFGPNAYYFAENGTHKWADVAEWVAEECHRQGYISDAATKKMTMEEASAIGASKTYALNSKGTAERAKKYLDWKPKGRSLRESLADLVKEEADRLNLKPNQK